MAYTTLGRTNGNSRISRQPCGRGSHYLKCFYTRMSYYGKLLLLRFPWPRVTAIFLTRTATTHTAPFNSLEIQISRVSIYYLTTRAHARASLTSWYDDNRRNRAVKIFFNQRSRPRFSNRRPNIQIFIHVTAAGLLVIVDPFAPFSTR